MAAIIQKIEGKPKKVLVTSHVGRHLRLFGRADIKVLQSMGYEVHFASNFNLDIDKVDDATVVLHQIDFSRSPFSVKNFKALGQMIKLLKNEDYRLMHCQSPTGGVVSRIAALIVGFKPVIYMVHGFPFYKDEHSLKNCIIKAIEIICARWTDCIITINEEDYQTAQRFKLRKDGIVFKTHGVGIEFGKFSVVSNLKKKELRDKLFISQDAFVVVCIGRLNKNKNQELLINLINRLKDKINNIILLLVGTDEQNGELQRAVTKLELNKHVYFMGCRNDIPNILALSDMLISVSIHEGLPVNVMEGMASGKTILVSRCRGNVDLVENGINGLVVPVNNIEETAKAVLKFYNDAEFSEQCKKANLEKIKKFSASIVQTEMKNIYEMIIERYDTEKYAEEYWVTNDCELNF